MPVPPASINSPAVPHGTGGAAASSTAPRFAGVSLAGAAHKKKKKKKQNRLAAGFGSDDGEDENNDKDAASGGGGQGGGRSKTNREISAQQDALRRRAQAKQKNVSKEEAAIYDYDGSYDQFSSNNNSKNISKDKTSHVSDNSNAQEGEEGKKPQARYIKTLLKTANERQHLLESIKEKQLSKQQKAEAAQDPELAGKEEFVTSAYKQKLAERKRWEEEQRRKDLEDEEGNAVKQGVAGMMGFHRKAVAGEVTDGRRNANTPDAPAAQDGASRNSSVADDKKRSHEALSSSSSSSQRPHHHTHNRTQHQQNQPDNQMQKQKQQQQEEDEETKKQKAEAEKAERRKEMLRQREILLNAARERYFQRTGIHNKQQKVEEGGEGGDVKTRKQ